MITFNLFSFFKFINLFYKEIVINNLEFLHRKFSVNNKKSY